jgi:hypothetical protein
VNDGSFQKILDNELGAIRQACQGKFTFLLSGLGWNFIV